MSLWLQTRCTVLLLIHSAKVASFFYRSEEFGISKENVRINMAAVRERKRKMVQNLVDAHLDLYKKSGAELVMGMGVSWVPRLSKPS
jgi:pyruvate/2-oxoglutarate dehydrogenase complex dihydrolipoamide dehydrogenase (E3) component